MADHSFWRGRKVFITGHTGFKGSWLCLWLHALGADVTGYALSPPTNPSLFEQANVGNCVKSLHGDVRDFQQLKNAVQDCQPDVVIHMAAQTVVRIGYDNPIETYSTNVMGTVHLLEAIRQLKRPCVVVNVTSDKCYLNREWAWGYREDEPMGDRDPYANSKGCSELVTYSYRESFFPLSAFDKHQVALGSARAGNVIGGGDWTPNQLIPDLLRSFLGGESCMIRSPFSIRPWQFVLEPLNGYLMLAEHMAKNPRFAQGWNFGPVDTDAKPVFWIANHLVKSWGEGASWTQDLGTHPHEAHYLKLDASMANLHLGWRARLPLQEALDWVVEWYRLHKSGADLRKITETQIERYDELCQV